MEPNTIKTSQKPKQNYARGERDEDMVHKTGAGDRDERGSAEKMIVVVLEQSICV